MRRLLPALLLFALACTLLAPPTAPGTGVQFNAPTTAPTLAPTVAPTSTAIPTVAPTATTNLHLEPSDVTFYPAPQLYSGDIVSVKVKLPPADPALSEGEAKLFAGSTSSAPMATARFDRFGIAGETSATFVWAWDTTGLEGPQTVVISVEPAGSAGEARPGEVLTLTVDLLPADRRPMPEPLAQWTQTESECCVFHYLTGTAAARDIEQIKAEGDAALAHVAATLGVTPQQKLDFTLLSRLLGHGGFTADTISITYLDRNPAANRLFNLFAHESTHFLDRQITSTKPTIMTEGLAVYVAGGHYKPDHLDQRAAALLALDRYLPLAPLADNFYPSQHEIGYVEAAAFVKFLVDTYGWERFKAFYGSFHTAASDSAMLNVALRENFGASLSEHEARWLASLRSLPPDPVEQADLRATVAIYDTLRRYQQALDPSAYYLMAWLPNGPEGRARGITADFVRHPTTPENIALETVLAAAQRALIAHEFEKADALLASVNTALDAHSPLADPLAADYLNVVHALAARGYEAQTIELDGDTATVTAIRDWPALQDLTLDRGPSGWALASGQTDSLFPFSRSIIFDPVARNQ